MTDELYTNCSILPEMTSHDVGTVIFKFDPITGKEFIFNRIFALRLFF